MTAIELRRAVLALPRADRAELAHELLQSLEESADEDAALVWVDEIERRAEQVAGGAVELAEWGDVRRRLAARLKARRENAPSP